MPNENLGFEQNDFIEFFPPQENNIFEIPTDEFDSLEAILFGELCDVRQNQLVDQIYSKIQKLNNPEN